MSDTILGIIGVGMLLGLVGLLVFVLCGGLRRGKKSPPIVIPLPVDEVRSRIRGWVQHERFEVLSEDASGGLKIRTMRMTQAGFVLLGVGLLAVGLLWGILWFVLGNSYMIVTTRPEGDGTQVAAEIFGAGTKKHLAKLLPALWSTPEFKV